MVLFLVSRSSCLITRIFTAQIILAMTCQAYFADWSVLAGDRQPTCVSIPQNMSLCHNIGYTKMRLPNLLEHDSMQEASQQAASWVPLLNVKCHADSQLFLCSLFAPVCLERPIYPCRWGFNKTFLIPLVETYFLTTFYALFFFFIHCK